MKSKLYLLFFLATFLQGYSQQGLQYKATFNAKGIIYSQEESPFWFHSNQRGRVDELSNLAGWVNGAVSYNITDNAKLEIGVGALYSDGYSDDIKLDESYLSLENNWLLASVGRKQREELYNGLSATNQNILWSLNARPLPGISLQTSRPIYLSKNAGIAFQAGIEEFITDDDRFVPDTRIHHKNFHLIFDKINNFELSVGVEHFVQWGGTSPAFGKLPGSFKDYLKVFSGKGTGEEVGGGNEVNGLGNHLGSYVAGIKTSLSHYNIEIIYNHLFEDGSGMRLGNTPDGRYGIYIEDQDQGKWIDAFMYELFYTKDQSGSTPTSDGADNYFNNNLYRSGWTYESRILGVPFITLDAERFRIANNKMMTHHIGLSGTAFSSFPYKILTSYRMNYGAKSGGNLRNNILSSYLDLNIYKNLFNVNVQLGADFNSIDNPNFGAGLHISKELF